MSTAADTKYVYVSNDKKVKVILVEKDEYGVVRISGDVESSSKPSTYHHTEILLTITGSASSALVRQELTDSYAIM
jgi:hypothetical protein